MRAALIAVLALGVGAVTAVAADEQPTLKDQKDKMSYSYGMNIGDFFKRQGIADQIDVTLMMAGLRDTLGGKKTLLTEAEAREVMMAFANEMRTKREAQMKVDGEKNKKAGDDFMAANAKKEGVKSFPDGLQYKVLKSGDAKGKQPKATDLIKAHYKGTLTDGTEFDSSYTRGQPLQLRANQVIPGWTEALTNMHVGDKWILYVPGNLGYGERGSPPKIGPNAVLIFEMELLEVDDTPAPAPGAVQVPK